MQSSRSARTPSRWKVKYKHPPTTSRAFRFCTFCVSHPHNHKNIKMNIVKLNNIIISSIIIIKSKGIPHNISLTPPTAFASKISNNRQLCVKKSRNIINDWVNLEFVIHLNSPHPSVYILLYCKMYVFELQQKYFNKCSIRNELEEISLIQLYLIHIFCIFLWMQLIYF